MLEKNNEIKIDKLEFFFFFFFHYLKMGYFPLHDLFVLTMVRKNIGKNSYENIRLQTCFPKAQNSESRERPK